MLPAHLTYGFMTCNTGTIVGTIVSDIDERQATDELLVVSFRVALCSARDGESPIPVVAYNETGERIFARYNKGDTVSLSYRLRYKTWQTPEGEPRGRMEVIAQTCDTIRLGQISQAKRAEAAAEAAINAEPVSPARAVRKLSTTTVRPVKARKEVVEPTLDEVPF